MKSEEFEAAVAPHREGLARFIAMMVGGEAEEIVQDTMTDALRQLDRFEGRSKFSTWLYSIAHLGSAICSWIRRRTGAIL